MIAVVPALAPPSSASSPDARLVAGTPSSPGTPSAPGLRERKKAQTRNALNRAALEIASDIGVEATTVEAIAERAGVSTRTFFNYYATKDDALIGYDPSVADRLRSLVEERPAQESTTRAVRMTLDLHLRELAENSDAWALRRRIAMSNPHLVTRMLGAGVALDRALVDGAVARTGRPRAEILPVVVEAYAAVGAFRAAVREHALRDFTGDLYALIDAAYESLPYDS